MILRIKKVIPLYERVGMFTEAPGEGSVSTSTATPSSSNDSDETDYTAGAEDTSSSDTSTSDSNESDTKVDEPEETDYTDGAEDNNDDSSGSEDGGDDSGSEDSGDDTDYTDGADDGGDSSGDDTSSDSSDSSGDSGSNDSVTKDDMRKYSLFSSCMDLYRTIQYFTERLETFTADNKYFNAASKKAKKIFLEAGDMLKDYLILKFQSDTYSQNSYFYENVKALCMLALHLMENNIPSAQIKNGNNKQ